MAASLIVLTGPEQSEKTHYLLSRYREALKTGNPGTVVWLAPTWRAAADVRNRILDSELEGCWEPRIFTFDKFAQTVIDSSGEPIRPLTGSLKRQLVRHLIDEQLVQGRLQYFQRIVSTGGLVDLVCEFISEFKRLEIWPEDFRRACQARGFTPKDQELLDLYDAYQITLRENLLYDAEGRFWSARDRLQQGQRRPFENLRLAVVDGFTDFTRTQHEILEQLALWGTEIIVSLTLESEPCRSDLFTKPIKTLNELKQRHSDVSVNELPRAANPWWPAMSHLEQKLFLNPRLIQPAHSSEGVEILAAAKPQGEMELIGSRIKLLLAEGIARPGDIAVVFRSPQDQSSVAAEVFDRLGIPAAWEMGQTFDRVPAMRALTNLLRLNLDDWPFRRLLAVLGSNYFRPDWPEWQDGKAAESVECAIRNSQIPRGRTILLNHLIAEKENLALSVLNRLAAALDELPIKATLPQWAGVLERLAQHTGLLRTMDNNDIVAWNRLITLLLADGKVVCWLKEQSQELDRNQAFRALIDILRSERMPAVDDESGRVRVLCAASVRSLKIPYLFLAGLSEKAFPLPDREDRLYSEAEYRQLIEKGLPLVARTERSREEMLLFYEAITRATRRLYLSFPALDDDAQPLSPSPYLLEVAQVFGGMHIIPEAADIRPIPTGEPLSAAQFRVKAMADALALSEKSPFPLTLFQNSPLPLGEGQGEGGDLSLIAGLLQTDIASSYKSNLFAGLELIVLRQDYERFGPAEGMLPGKAVQKSLAMEFSSNRCFTASELEQYACCPYRFLLQNILKLEPLEDIALQLDYLERGQTIHEVLASFHCRVNESLGRPGSPLELAEEDFDRLLQKALDESHPHPSSNPVRTALTEINRRLITKWLAGYREQYKKYDKLWENCDSPLVPEFFEASFGKSKHQQGTLAVNAPLEFPDGKDVICISGRIDRIDTGKVAQINVFNILDYKTGGSPKFSMEDVKRGIALQLPLYALATEQLILNNRDPRPWQAGYWHIVKDGFRSRKSLVMYELIDDGVKPTADWEECLDVLTRIIPVLVQEIRSGCFPVFNPDQNCTGYCPYNTICRIRQIRSLEKTWQPMP